MKMQVNLHTHTTRSHHASGTEREYIENAIAGGLTRFGFSDHAPYVFRDGYYSYLLHEATRTGETMIAKAMAWDAQQEEATNK